MKLIKNKMSSIDKKEITKIIENQINLSLNLKLNDSQIHPLRIIQASKALIGLNLDSPNKKLIHFNKLYLESQTLDNYKSIQKNNGKLNDVVSLQDLEDALINNDREVAIEIFNQIKLVSSEVHILEFLIEIALKQTGKSFLNIWSLYKSVLFLKNKSIDKFAHLVIDMILNDKFRNIDNQLNKLDIEDLININFTNNSLDLYAHLYEAYKMELIRSENIRKLINLFISDNFRNLDYHSSMEKFKPKYPKLLSNGRAYILDIVNEKKYRLSPDMILFLDSIRTLFRFTHKKNHKIIVYHLESKLEAFNV
tara:strand:- start:19575 stop:20501 length:927 start_codon:yes stop_codon:yes gene_type:complete